MAFVVVWVAVRKNCGGGDGLAGKLDILRGAEVG